MRFCDASPKVALQPNEIRPNRPSWALTDTKQNERRVHITRRVRMGASRYMFIVKDSGSESFSKSDDHERRLIHRHVQISSIHRKRPVPFIEVHPQIKHNRSRNNASVASNNASTTSTSQPSTDPQLQCRCFGPSRSPC